MKTKLCSACIARLFCIALVELFVHAGITLAAGETKHVEIIAPRALYEGIKLLESQFGEPVSYEEPAYIFSEDLQPLFPSSRSLIPKRRRISIHYNESEGLGTALEKLVSAYVRQSGSAEFEIHTDTTGLISVAADVSRDSVGKRKPYRSPLLSPIDTIPQIYSLGRVFELVGSAVSNQIDRYVYRNLNRAFITNSYQLIVTKPTRYNARELLNDVLTQFNHSSGVKASWSLLRSPQTDDAVLGVHLIGSPREGDHLLRITGQRPLDLTLSVLEQAFHCTIGYEDPPYQCPCELLSDYNGIARAPNGGVISFSYASTDAVDKILDRLLDEYYKQGNPGHFQATNLGSGVFSVYPAAIKNTEGEKIPVQALSTEILCTNAQSIGEAISNMTNKARLGQLDLDSDAMRFLSAVKMPERPLRMDKFLAQTFSDVDSSKTWRILYDPASTNWVLRIYDRHRPVLP